MLAPWVVTTLLGCTVGAELFLVGFAAACEFDLKFSRCVYGLRPVHLREDPYLFLDSILDWSSTRRSRRRYISWSVAAVVFAAAAVCFTAPGQDLTRALFPPAVYEPLARWSAASRLHAYAVWSGFFALGFHAFPLLGALRAASSSSSTGNMDTSPGVRVLRRMFAFHEYLLDRQIMTLLQYENPEPPLRPDDPMSIAHALKLAVASEMQRCVSESALNHAYAEMLEAGVVPKHAAREHTGGRPSSDVEKLTELIQGRGIPFTRSRFEWRTRRGHAVRQLLAEKVTVEVAGKQIPELWIDDIGRPNVRSAWNGFLLRFPNTDDEAEALFRYAQSFRIKGLAGSAEEFDCKVTRTDEQSESEKRARTLYIGAVVQNRDIHRFNRLIDAVLKTAKPQGNGSVSGGRRQSLR